MVPCSINHRSVLTTPPPIAKKTIKVKLVDLLWKAINHTGMRNPPSPGAPFQVPRSASRG